MKEFIRPELTIIDFTNDDIITSSGESVFGNPCEGTDINDNPFCN